MNKQSFLKAVLLLLTFCLSLSNTYAQAPQKMSYQAVIRNNSNALVTNQQVGVKISVLQGNATGTVVFAEIYNPNPVTNANGSVSLEIGTGVPITGTFANINWANGPYFIKTETDPTGGTNYTIAGTSQLLSVPYALFSANGTNAGAGGFTHYLGEAYLGGIIYYLYKGSDGLEHGLIVSLTESTAAWQTTASIVNANRTEDGAFNTNLMTGSPAKTYIATLGTGWYLPSIDELALLYYNRFTVQKALRAGNNTLLSNKNTYWSSTEHDIGYTSVAYIIDFYSGSAGYIEKTGTFTVRGVRAF
jgi:hypothetical protein